MYHACKQIHINVYYWEMCFILYPSWFVRITTYNKKIGACHTQYNTILCKSVNCDAVTPWADISTVSLWGRSWCPSVRMLWWTPPARLSLILCSNQDYHAFSLGQAFTFSLGQASASSCDWDYHTFSLGQLSADFEIAHLAAKTTFRSNPFSVYWNLFHSSCRF